MTSTTSTTLSVSEYLKYADLQMAAEAFIRDPKTDELRNSGQLLIRALMTGNDHSSSFTRVQATEFESQWEALDQIANTTTGFSGTLFRNKDTDELVMSFRSTEFIDDAARDNQATNLLEIATSDWLDGAAGSDTYYIDNSAQDLDHIADLAKFDGRMPYDLYPHHQPKFTNWYADSGDLHFANEDTVEFAPSISLGSLS
jgi:hypothetical protein